MAELTGMDAFEEVINPKDLAGLGDPLKERLGQIASSILSPPA